MEGWKDCPHCGARLPGEASFCPFCARRVNERREVHPPRYIPGRALRCALLVLVLLAAALTAWLCTRPRVYDNGTAEIIYTDDDGSYQLLLNYFGDRFQPMTDYTEEVEEGTASNKPSRLLVNHVDTGVNAKEVFRRKVDSVTVELLRGEDGPEPWQFTRPAIQNYDLEAAYRSILTYTDRSGDMELRWTIRMRNGDTIRLYQRMELGVAPPGTSTRRTCPWTPWRTFRLWWTKSTRPSPPISSSTSTCPPSPTRGAWCWRSGP